MNCFGRFPVVKNAPQYCVVELLDGSELKFPIRDEDCGLVLLQKVWDHLNLFEREYFSLRFLNTAHKTSFWLDAQKNIQKQLKRHGIKETYPKFYFSVKFYAVDPCSLKEEITRYQFFQQLRRDVGSGRLPLSFDSLAYLGALVAQSEFGDYNPRTHTAGYLFSLRLTADGLSDDLRSAITEIHRDKLRGVLPSQCELLYLDAIKKQDVYGVEFYNTRGAANAEYKVGASPHGIVIYRGKHRVTLYHWPRIEVINFKSKELNLQVKDKHGSESTNHSFTCASTRVCKQLWKSCIEHHSFFRMSQTAKQDSTEKGGLFHLGSKYRYSGRTEKEIASVQLRTEQPVVNRPLSHRLSLEKQSSSAINTKDSNGWIGKMDTQHPAQGMFTSANDSPGSVRSLKLKFQPKNTDTEGSLRKHSSSRTPRSHSLDGESLRCRHSNRRSDSRERRSEGTPRNKRHTAVPVETDHQSSVSRILRSYIPSNNTPLFNSDDVRRHSDRQLPIKRREYENIVYNNQGLPVILATHKGEKADEKMPFYQQEWLQRTLQQKSTTKDHTTILGKAPRTTRTPEINYQNDPLMYQLLHPPTKDDIRKTSLGFYEDKLINRDSGTDSPTCNQYDDPNVHELIQTMDREHQKIANGGLNCTTASEWKNGWRGNHYSSENQHQAKHAGTAVNSISKVTLI